MILQKILRFAEEDLARVELEIRQQLSSEVDRIGEIGRYLLLSGGKRIRPILLLLTAKLAGYSGERIFPLSAMIEFMHTATLLHDDVIDHSHLRRGHPTVNSRWGSALSILVGDFLYAKAMALVVDDGDPQILKEITRVTMTMTEGQVMETLRIGDTSLTGAEYRQIIRQKTAALFGACCYIGGVLGGLPAERAKACAASASPSGARFSSLMMPWTSPARSSASANRWGVTCGRAKLRFPLSSHCSMPRLMNRRSFTASSAAMINRLRPSRTSSL